MHPQDNRAVFIIPWESAVLVGTTDLDHPQDLSIEPNIAEAEVTYLMEGIQAIFPSLNISLADCLCAFAGIRPVLSEGKLKPSEESREHVVWVDHGLVTVTGGKLTTFRRLALDALHAAKTYLPPDKMADRTASVFSKVQQLPALEYGLSMKAWRRLYGRYGNAADTIVKTATVDDLTSINGTHTLWAELPYVAQNEQIRHLGDLMLRRVRIGLLTPQGGKAYLKRIQKLCKKVLPWDRRRWKEEINIYLAQWNHAHALPIQRAEVPVQRKIISFKALGALSNSIYHKFASGKKHRKSSGIS
jgi:glycerol-3-phosphate dehydrogenase